jgi:carboxyl-terminal processing protease
MAKVDGIVLDVHDGGGSLSTVVDIAGLFIEQGPYCTNQISRKKKKGSISIEIKKLSGMVH